MNPKTDPKTAQKVLKKWGLKRDPRPKSGREIFIKILEGLPAPSEAPAAYIPTSFELCQAFTP